MVYSFKYEDTVIGNDIGIGYNMAFMPRVKITVEAIIGTSSLITKNIGPYKVIQYLEKIQWWNQDIKKIAENVDVLIGKDLEKLKEPTEGE